MAPSCGVPLLAVLAVLAASLSGCGSSKPADCPCPAAAAAPVDPPSSPELDALARDRVAKSIEVIKLRQAMYERGATTLAEFLRSYRDAAQAVRESKLKKEERVTRLRAYADAALKLRDLMRERAQRGAVTPADVASTELTEIEARYWLREATEGR